MILIKTKNIGIKEAFVSAFWYQTSIFHKNVLIGGINGKVS
jgi:hypothetical protein